MSARLAAALTLGLAFAAPAALIFSPPAAAHDYKLGTLTIEHPWARASAGMAKTGAAFVTIGNQGAEADRLLSVSTPVAATAELHTHMMDGDGVMKMRQVEAVELAPGTESRLAPGGLHIMLMGLAAPLVEDATFPLTLRFEHAGELTVEVEVGSVAAMGGDDGGPDMEHMDGEHMHGTSDD
jgi:copper(I)-binding protein